MFEDEVVVKVTDSAGVVSDDKWSFKLNDLNVCHLAKHHNHSSTLHCSRFPSLLVLDQKSQTVDFVSYVRFVPFSNN